MKDGPSCYRAPGCTSLYRPGSDDEFPAGFEAHPGSAAQIQYWNELRAAGKIASLGTVAGRSPDHIMVFWCTRNLDEASALASASPMVASGALEVTTFAAQP